MRTIKYNNKEFEIEDLYLSLAHGDNDHKEWLKTALYNYFQGKDIPAPYGKGSKDILIDNLNSQIIFLQKQVRLLNNIILNLSK